MENMSVEVRPEAGRRKAGRRTGRFAVQAGAVTVASVLSAKPDQRQITSIGSRKFQHT